MNNKALATIILAILLIGTFGFAFNIVPKTNADMIYYTLKIDYAPKPMVGDVVPTTAPPVGTDSYTAGTSVNMTAPMYVSAGTGIQYVFQNWTFHDDTNNVTDGSTNNPVYTTSPLDRNWTATAMYNLQYLFTVTTPYDTAWIYDPSGPFYYSGTGSVSKWFDAGKGINLRAGLSTGQVQVGAWYHLAEFTGWTGDASGNPGAPITGTQWSNPLNLTGYKSATAMWKEEYYLFTGSTYVPWDGGTPYDPDKVGFYDLGTDVALTAPTYNQENLNHYRWRFDRWEISHYNGTAWNVVDTKYTENITVHMDEIHLAIVYFHLQYYLTVQSSPSVLDKVEYQSRYYDYCTNVTLTAPQYIDDPTDPVGARWKFKEWFISSVIDWYQTVLTVHILGGWDKTAYAIYTKQYYIRVKTNPASILTKPNVYFTGEGWYDTGAPWTLTALNTTIMEGTETKYLFVTWDFSENGGSPQSNPASWVADRAWNGTAVYKKQYRATAICDPVNTGTTDLNTWNTWPIAGYELWADENSLVAWSAGSGPVGGYPFDCYFDRWTVNGVDQTQYVNAFNLNFTGPKTTVAHYEGKSAFFITPQTVLKKVPSYCTPFEVNVTAANLVDLYALDFNVTWDATLLELVSSNVKVGQIWNQSVFWENKLPGNYHLMATQTAPGLGFNGTHTIVTLTFHIIYDPCYLTPYYKSCVIGLVGPALGGTYPQLSDSKGNGMLPWNRHGSSYTIDAVKPTLYMKPSTVTVSQKDATFTVEIWIRNATKLSDWWTTVIFNSTLLEVTNVVLDTTFLTGPYSINIVNFNVPGEAKIEVAQLLPGNPANGTGRLATIYFRVKYSIFWTTAYPTLSCLMQFKVSPGTGISVMCPEKNYAYAPTDVGVENCLYTYRPIPGDVNKDGIVNSLDLQLVANEYGSYTLYDLNKDGKVDLLDIVLVAINFGKTSP